jgi:hypothetical protein
MAGSGRKDWTAGAQVAAADMDAYLMEQTVMQFATSGARDTALSSILDEGLLSTPVLSHAATSLGPRTWPASSFNSPKAMSLSLMAPFGITTKSVEEAMGTTRLLTNSAGTGVGSSGWPSLSNCCSYKTLALVP